MAYTPRKVVRYLGYGRGHCEPVCVWLCRLERSTDHGIVAVQSSLDGSWAPDVGQGCWGWHAVRSLRIYWLI